MKLDMEIASSSWNDVYQNGFGSDGSSDYSGRNGDSPPAAALNQACDGLSYTDSGEFTLLPGQGSMRQYTAQLLNAANSCVQPTDSLEDEGYVSMPAGLKHKMNAMYGYQDATNYYSLESRRHKQLQRRYSSPPTSHRRGYWDQQYTRRPTTPAIKHHSSLRNINGTTRSFNGEFSRSKSIHDIDRHVKEQNLDKNGRNVTGKTETVNDLIYSPRKQKVSNGQMNGHSESVAYYLDDQQVDRRNEHQDLSQTYPKSLSEKRSSFQNGVSHGTIRRRLWNRAKSVDHAKFVRTPSPIPENDELALRPNGFNNEFENRNNCNLTKTALYTQYNTLKKTKQTRSDSNIVSQKIPRSNSLNSIGDSDSDNDDYGFLPLYGDVIIKPSNVVSTDMQKNKSPAVARRILPKKWRKPKALPQSKPKPGHGWTSEGNCKWSNSAGRQVTLTQINMVHLSDVERLVLQKLALAKVQAMDLGCPIIIPKEALPKRKKFSLKRRPTSGSNLVGLLDNLKSMTENIKTKTTSKETSKGKVFGIPLSKCINNDKEIRYRRSSLLKERRESLDLAHIPHRFRKSSSSSVSYGLTLVVRPLLVPPLLPPPRPQSLWVASMCRNHSSSSVFSLSDNIVRSVGGAFSSDSLTDLDPKDSGGNLLEALSLTTSTHRLETVWKEKHNSLQANQPRVPYVVDSCLKHIETYGLHTLGIFRKGSSKKRTKQLREEFDRGSDVKLSDEHNPHEVAALLKEYFRDLPDPLMTRDLYNAFIATRKISNLDQRLFAYHYLLALLPPANRDTFWLLIRFLNLVSQHSKDTVDHMGNLLEGNKMDSNNLATLFGPNILHKAKGGLEKDYQVENSERAEESRDIINIVKDMIENYIRIFMLSGEMHDECIRILKDTNPEAVDVLLKRKSTVSLEISADPPSTYYDESDGSLPRSPGATSLPEGGLPKSFTEGMLLDMDQRRPQSSTRLHTTDIQPEGAQSNRVPAPGAWYLPDSSTTPRSPVLRPKQPRNSTPPRLAAADKSRLGVPQNLSDRSRSSSSEGRIGLPPSGLSRSGRKTTGSPMLIRKDNRLGVPGYSRESSMSSLGSYPNTPMSTSPCSLGPPSPRLSSVPSSPSSLCSRLNDHSDRETSPYRPLSNMSQRPLSMTRQRPVSMSSHSIGAQDMQRDRWKKWERLAQESGEEFHEQETLV